MADLRILHPTVTLNWDASIAQWVELYIVNHRVWGFESLGCFPKELHLDRMSQVLSPLGLNKPVAVHCVLVVPLIYNEVYLILIILFCFAAEH